jgi:glycosyltransferase involved in cell wall biosynthesis
MAYTYHLLTAAYNEEKYISQTIASVIRQQVRPGLWVIVSDGSTDKTNTIVADYAAQFAFIKLLPLPKKQARSICSKVLALRRGYTVLQPAPSEFIGNLDADILLPPDYYQRLMDRFYADSRLGLASGIYYEFIDGTIKKQKPPAYHTPGAIQLFRRSCFDAIAGYPLIEGGEDVAAGVKIRMSGWQTRSFPELEVIHLKPSGTGSRSNAFQIYSSFGRIDYQLGVHPLFCLLKSLYRLSQKPCLIQSLGLLWGFFTNYFTFKKRPVDAAFIRFLRQEQWQRLKRQC